MMSLRAQLFESEGLEGLDEAKVVKKVRKLLCNLFIFQTPEEIEKMILDENYTPLQKAVHIITKGIEL